MWSSLTPKLLHISPRWLVITDHQRKVELLYAAADQLDCDLYRLHTLK